MDMKEWRVVVKTEKVIRCMPDILYVKNGYGILTRIEAKIRENECEYILPESKENPEVYILVSPSDIQNAYILCRVEGDTIYEKLVSYDEIRCALNNDVSKLITKQFYKEKNMED